VRKYANALDAEILPHDDASGPLRRGGFRKRGFRMMVSTTNDVTGFKIVRHLGVVRGITVRSRSVVGNFVGGIQSIFGGKIDAYVQLSEAARQEAFDHMCAHAAQGGANAIVGMRYDANEIMDGITEVLAYGTAVWAEPLTG